MKWAWVCALLLVAACASERTDTVGGTVGMGGMAGNPPAGRGGGPANSVVGRGIGGGGYGGGGIGGGGRSTRASSYLAPADSVAKTIRASDVLQISPEAEEFQKRMKAAGLLSTDGTFLL